MCTAITYKTKDHYFGRNMDYEFSYDETVTVMPRNYEFIFRKAGSMATHYAMIGIAYVVDDYPLYYDATNEKGLSMAGLNFPGNADYKPEQTDKQNVSPFEFIPYVLGQCATIAEVKALFEKMNLVNIHFSEELPLTPLHWMISDRESSITVESVQEGLKVYDNPIGVLTNNPPFDYQMFNLNHYMHLTKEEPQNAFSQKLDLQTYSRGMGALGLPGDLSSMSRFVRATFVKMNSISGESEKESVGQFFHILGAVEQQRGCVHMGDEQYEMTIYTSCCNTDKGIYYYTTYDNRQITGIDMNRENLDGSELISYELVKGQRILMPQDDGMKE
ncbi:MAG: choloylglycine hydrolase family protein [Lachnospiraceae bacterium]|nr:choloylglycine hydrolase family protein [Lachnospiraceae bacterium]